MYRFEIQFDANFLQMLLLIENYFDVFVIFFSGKHVQYWYRAESEKDMSHEHTDTVLIFAHFNSKNCVLAYGSGCNNANSFGWL